MKPITLDVTCDTFVPRAYVEFLIAKLTAGREDASHYGAWPVDYDGAEGAA